MTRTALDDLRAALVLIDGGPGCTLVRRAIATLELEHAANTDRAHAARHVPVLTPAENAARSVTCGDNNDPREAYSAALRDRADKTARREGWREEEP